MAQQTKTYTVITGASSGIGREAARAFAARGRNLILTARRRDRLETLREELLGHDAALDIVIKPADLSEPGAARRFYEELRPYKAETWINSAGFGSYDSVAGQDLEELERMIRLDVEAMAILSALFVRDYRDTAGAQLINISSCGGYTIVPHAVPYCAAKFYVSAFTEGLARELRESHRALRAKVLAPAATETEFGQVANHAASYDYSQAFGTYHTAKQMATFLLKLYDSDRTVGLVDRETFQFRLLDPLLPYAGNSSHNQRTR